MFGMTEFLVMSSNKEEAKDSLKSAYGKLFQEIFASLGESQSEVANMIGMSPQAYGARIHGRRLPDLGNRTILCLALQALREKATDAERRGLVERGLRLMREIEEENGLRRDDDE